MSSWSLHPNGKRCKIDNPKITINKLHAMLKSGKCQENKIAVREEWFATLSEMLDDYEQRFNRDEGVRGRVSQVSRRASARFLK
jgi:hypothetical protein